MDPLIARKQQCEFAHKIKKNNMGIIIVVCFLKIMDAYELVS